MEGQRIASTQAPLHQDAVHRGHYYVTDQVHKSQVVVAHTFTPVYLQRGQI